MQKNLILMAILMGIVALTVSAISPVATAESSDNLRDEMAYGYSAMLERQTEKERERQFVQTQQQEYRQQQQLINRLDNYNQTRYSNAETYRQYSSER